MTPDKYQAAFISAVADTEAGNLLADAKAGTGKSSTVEAALSHLPPRTSSVVLAFNKAIASGMQERIERANIPLASAKTFNSIGHGVLARNLGKITLNRWKTGELMKRAGFHFKERSDAQAAERLVGIAKASALRAEEVSWPALAQHMGYALPESVEGKVFEAAAAAFALTIPTALGEGLIDFDDQLYIPVVQQMPLPKWSYVFVDEAQDVSPVQLEMLTRMTSGRLFAVGDVRQAIYGFRGADSNAISAITSRAGLSPYPLNICYRCATSIIEKVQELVPDIEARPGAPAGEVTYAGYTRMRNFGPRDAILCRNNAPLFSLAARFVEHRIAFQIKGEGIAEVLFTYIGKAFSDANLPRTANPPIATAAAIMREFFRAEVLRNEKRGAFGMCDALEDYASIFHALTRIPGVGDMQDLYRALEHILGGKSGPTLSSVHRAKGLEFPRVWIYRPDLMPSQRAKEPWQKQQEQNLMYVAWTRAQQQLTFLPEGMVEGAMEEEEEIA